MISPDVLLAAATAGLLGSLHCAAMCGPLALAGCSVGGRVQVRASLGYFAGRVVSYATLGAALGAAGRHALCLLPVGNVQLAALAVAAGFAAWRAFRLLAPAPAPAGLVPLAARPPRRGWLVQALPARGLGLGLVTGFLPCAMLLPAWTLATGSGDPASGAALMAVFALATAPGLLLPLLGGAALRRAFARITPAWHGALWLALAAWLTLRPLLGAVHHH